MGDVDRNVKLYGTPQAPVARRVLRAGPLSIELEGGNVRYLRFGDVEVLRGINFLVRDKNWGTFSASLEDLKVDEAPDHFIVSYGGACVDGDNRLDFTAKIIGKASGTLRFELQMDPQSDFVTNRAGFTVLHPLQGVAGCPIFVEHTDGDVSDVLLPRHISPEQPLMDIAALTHQPDKHLRATVRFEGDTFEMEDQRNWTDASFKTYVRPLALPFPYTLAAGKSIKQAVEVKVRLTAEPPQDAPEEAGSATVTVDKLQRMPAMPEFGMGIRAEDLQEEVAPAFTGIGLRSWVAFVDGRQNVDAALAKYTQFSGKTDVPLTLEVVVPCQAPLEEELSAIASACQNAGLRPATVLLSPAADLKTGSPFEGTLPELSDIYAAGKKAFPDSAIGGGMFAYFTELNRKRPPSDRLDVVTHTTCHTVHAADETSVLETLETMPWVFESTRAFIGDKPYHLGPSAIGMRDNPYGAAPADNPDAGRVAMAKDDPRQQGLFGAAFYVGYAALAAQSGIEQLSLCAPTGPFGVASVADGNTRLAPAYHVLRALAGASGCKQIHVEATGTVAAVAWKTDDGARMVLANLSEVPCTVKPGVREPQVAMLDAASFALAQNDPAFFDKRSASDALELDAFAVAMLSF